MNNIKIDISRLRESREKLGITRMEAAKRISVSQGAYVRYENGTRTPSIQVVTEMAHVFNTSVDYLLGKTNTKKPTSYTINKATEPEIFQIIEISKKLDVKDKQRLLAYAISTFK